MLIYITTLYKVRKTYAYPDNPHRTTPRTIPATQTVAHLGLLPQVGGGGGQSWSPSGPAARLTEHVSVNTCLFFCFKTLSGVEDSAPPLPPPPTYTLLSTKTAIYRPIKDVDT